MQKVFLRAQFNYDPDVASIEAGYSDDSPSMTQQHFAEECDINTIVKRFGLTGQLPENVSFPVSGDFTGVSDFASAMRVVRAAEEAFMELPGDVRYEFSNDPQRLMDFLGDERNRARAVQLGLVAKPVEVDRSNVPVAEAVPVVK